MTHYLVDANALLRYLRNDIPDQAEQVTGLFRQAKQGKILITISIEVILETVYVLLKYYRENKEVIGNQLFDFISLPMISIEKRDIVGEAFLLWKTESISFVDCLVLAQSKIEGKMLFTFDRKLRQLAGGLTKENKNVE